MADSPVMLRCAQHLTAQRDRPFAALRVTPWGSSRRDTAVMLSEAKHLTAQRDRPFAALRACPERSEGGDSGGADIIIRLIF